MFLTRFAVFRPVTTSMACLIVILLGWMSVRSLRVDLMPDMTWPIITVTTLYPGAGPEEVETLITRPMEQTIGSVQGVERMSSQSSEGSSSVRVQFSWGTNLDPAIGDIRARLERLRNDMPPGVEPPYIRRYDSADSPIIYLGLRTDLPPVQATQLAENSIAPRLEQAAGVARIRVRGGTRREIQVDLDRQKIESLDMTVKEVLDALGRDNINQPAGDLDEGHLRMLVRTRGEFTSIDQISDTVIRQREGAVVRIRDVGQVIDGEEERTEETRINGENGLLIYVYMQSGANTVDVSEAVRKKIEEINESTPDGQLSIRVDKSDYIRQAIANVRDSALYGSGLAIIVLIVFLRSFRSTLVIAATMPLSVLATFVLIYFYGLSLNMISFGGLALGIGLLVDNSIVVLESIFRKREEGFDRFEAAILCAAAFHRRPNGSHAARVGDRRVVLTGVFVGRQFDFDSDADNSVSDHIRRRASTLAKGDCPADSWNQRPVVRRGRMVLRQVAGGELEVPTQRRVPVAAVSGDSRRFEPKSRNGVSSED